MCLGSMIFINMNDYNLNNKFNILCLHLRVSEKKCFEPVPLIKLYIDAQGHMILLHWVIIENKIL